MFTRSRGSVLVNLVPPKKEPESAPTDGGDGDGGGADNHKEDPESNSIDVYYHPVKEEPEPELGDGDGDAVVVNGNGDCDPPEDEPEIVAAGDDTDADSGPDVGYDCRHCGISLRTRKFKVKHELRCKAQIQQKKLESQVTKLYHCCYCRCPFVTEELKEQHQQRRCRKRPIAKKKCSNDPYFGCDKCEYVTKWKGNLEIHVLKHNKNNAEWFTCTHCSYKTVRKEDMSKHMKIHSNTFTYCCWICGKSFRSKQYLDDHLLRRHSDEWDEVAKLITSKIYTCHICNQFRTTLKTNFNVHLTIKHLKGVGRQKYECPRCPYSTFCKYTLKRHSKTHAEQKDYRCTVCKRPFSEKQQLDSHVLCIHADNVDLVKTITSKIHRCESCSFKTVFPSKLKNHVRSKHI